MLLVRCERFPNWRSTRKHKINGIAFISHMRSIHNTYMHTCIHIRTTCSSTQKYHGPQMSYTLYSSGHSLRAFLCREALEKHFPLDVICSVRLFAYFVVFRHVGNARRDKSKMYLQMHLQIRNTERTDVAKCNKNWNVGLSCVSIACCTVDDVCRARILKINDNVAENVSPICGSLHIHKSKFTLCKTQWFMNEPKFRLAVV